MHRVLNRRGQHVEEIEKVETVYARIPELLNKNSKCAKVSAEICDDSV